MPPPTATYPLQPASPPTCMHPDYGKMICFGAQHRNATLVVQHMPTSLGFGVYGSWPRNLANRSVSCRDCIAQLTLPMVSVLPLGALKLFQSGTCFPSS